MIQLVTGGPGSGKSYYTVRRIIRGLEAGKWVATNVLLHDGWEMVAARRNPFRRVWPEKAAATAEAFAHHAHVSVDLDELMRLRLPPCGRCSGCKKGRTCRTEGRGLMVLDEAHEWLNARTWDASTDVEMTKSAAVQRRLDIVQFFSQHRHFGWDIDIISQDAANLDAQVRRNFEYHVHLKNMKRWKPLGLPLFPLNLFAAVTTWNDREGSKLKTEVYRLDTKLADLYDSMARASPERDRTDTILMGSQALRRVGAPVDAARAIGPPRPAGVASEPPGAVTGRDATTDDPSDSPPHRPLDALDPSDPDPLDNDRAPP